MELNPNAALGDLRLLHHDLAGIRCLLTVRGVAATQPPRAVVLMIPPFLEEMNKSRRQLTHIAKNLSREGIGTVLPDLPGTGDSDGELLEQSLTRWQRALSDCVGLIRTEIAPNAPIVMMGLRLGALLGMSVWPEVARAVRGACWVAPVLNGEQHLTQFLRYAVAGAALRGEGASSTRELRERLSHRGEIEVAGYALSANLVDSLGALRAPEQIPQGSCHVIEVISRADVPLALPLQSCLDVWRSAHQSVSFEQIVGESFWSSSEITTIPALAERVAKSVVALADPRV